MMGERTTSGLERKPIRLLDYYDAVFLTGTLEAGRRLAEAMGLSPTAVLEATVAAANQARFWENGYDPLRRVLALESQAVPEWPFQTLAEWDRFSTLVQQIAQNPANSALEQVAGFVDLAFRAGYLLWTEFDRELFPKFAELLFDLHLPEEVTQEVLTGVRSPDTETRLAAFSNVRTYLSLHGGQVELRMTPPH